MGDLVKCPICGADDWKPILVGDGFSVQLCANGCIARTYPPPPPECKPEPPGGFTQTVRDAVCTADFRFAERILGRISRYKASGRLLDIGSGAGHLVKLSRERGFDAVGVEMTELGVEYARQALDIDIIPGSFPEYEFAPTSFDVVVMKHVLEHVSDPVAVMAEISRILCPDGIVVIESPNYNSLMRMVKRSAWQGIQPTQHTWQLSPSSTSKLLLRHGLNTVDVILEDLEYRRGTGSPSRWMALRAILSAARLLHLQDNFTVIARRFPL